jgi:hypothetical protein
MIPHGNALNYMTVCRVEDSHHFNAVPDPDPAPHQGPVMPICDHRSTGPSGLHFKPQRLHCEHSIPSHFETLKLLNFDCNANPDPALQPNE